MHDTWRYELSLIVDWDTRSGRVELVEYLLHQHGFDFPKGGRGLMTPYIYQAVNNGQLDIVKLPIAPV
jgi:hypothetical protein